MNYLVIEFFDITPVTYYGPFPSHDQALTFGETQIGAKGKRVTYAVYPLLAPATMPAKIHA